MSRAGRRPRSIPERFPEKTQGSCPTVAGDEHASVARRIAGSLPQSTHSSEPPTDSPTSGSACFAVKTEAWQGTKAKPTPMILP